jgi:hypothetical protein
MATLSFEGETHQELVGKVKKWLASQSGDERLSASDAVAATADLTKEALRIVASAAPEPIAQNDIVKALTGMGYKATDASRDAVLQSLSALSTVTGGGLLKQVSDAQAAAVWEMNQQVAKQVLKGLSRRR